MNQYRADHSSIDLCRYRIDKANGCLNDAHMLFNAGSIMSANNRAYYSIFHAMNAINALDGVAFKQHKGVISNFNMRYVKAGIFPRELGSAINNAELVRHVSDYDDFYVADRNETIRQMELAERVIFMVERYCIDRINRGLV